MSMMLVEDFDQLKRRVCMMGDTNVGKSSIISQFVNSEYMKEFDTSLGKINQLDYTKN